MSLRPPLERVCILGFAGTAANSADHASSWELVRLLNRCATETDALVVETVPAPVGPPVGIAHWPRIVRAAIEQADPDDGIRSAMLRIARTMFGAVLERVANADHVIVQGVDRPSSQSDESRLLGLVMPWIAQHVFSIPIAWLNQSTGGALRDGSDPEARLARLAGRQWGGHSQAFQRLRDAGCQRPLLVPDTVFLVEPLEHGDLARELDGRKYFCVDGGSLSAAPNDVWNTVRLIVAATGMLPVFVGNATVAAEDLRASAAALRIESAAIPADMIYPAVADVIGRAECVVGLPGRLAMMAAVSGTPTVFVADRAACSGLCDLLSADWPTGCWSRGPELAAAVEWLVQQPAEARVRVRERVVGIRETIVSAGNEWRPERSRSRPPVEPRPAVPSCGHPPVLPQLMPLTVYLRRGVTPVATFQCLRQLIEHRLDDVLEQLDARWLVSICDSYADHAAPVEARNALLIATFVNWERLAATHVLWADPQRCTMRIDAPIPPHNVPLWDGLWTVHLRRGDTVNNMLIRYARLLAATPCLLAIWRTLLARIRKSDSVLAGLDRPHGHLFDEHLSWMGDERLTDIPRWRRPPRPHNAS